jgi:hypothetical protein
MQIAKYPAQSNAAPNNLASRAFISAISYVEAFWNAAKDNLMQQASIFKVGDARLKICGAETLMFKVVDVGLNNLMKRTSIFKVGDAGQHDSLRQNSYVEAFLEEARYWSAAFSSRSFTNAKSTRFAGVAMPSSLPRRAT